ncbi:MAG: hypothetical protein K6L73_01565 [Cellvibrionaceae bacterium]
MLRKMGLVKSKAAYKTKSGIESQVQNFTQQLGVNAGKPSLMTVAGSQRAGKNERCVLTVDPLAIRRQVKGRDWVGTFNFSAWLLFHNGLGSTVNLVFRYRDSERVKTVFIDRCLPACQHTILLNGQMPVEVKGDVMEAGLYLVGVNESVDMKIEESLVKIIADEPVVIARQSSDKYAQEMG